MAVYYYTTQYDDYLMHYGIKNQKWGVRRFQNEDGSLTPAGIKRYRVDQVNGAIGNRKKYAKDVGKNLNKLEQNIADKFGESMIRKDRAERLEKKYDSYVDKRKQKLGIGENDIYVDASKKGMKKASKYNKAAEKYNNLRSGISENESNRRKAIMEAERKGFDITQQEIIRTSKAGRSYIGGANAAGYTIAGPIGGAIAGMARANSLDRKYGPKYGGQSPVTIYGNKYKAYDNGKELTDHDRNTNSYTLYDDKAYKARLKGKDRSDSNNNKNSYKGLTYEQASNKRSAAIENLNSVGKRYNEGMATQVEHERTFRRVIDAEKEYLNAKKRSDSTNNEKSYKGPTYEQASKMRSTALKDLNSVEKRYKEGKATELEYERAVERWSEAETEYENAKKRR